LIHLQVKESLKDTKARSLYNYIIESQRYSLKLNYGGYDKNDKAYDFSLICPNGLYRGNYEKETQIPNFIIKIV